jgi:starch synthase
MPRPIGILFVASEADPFVKTGSIGEIAGSLPKTLKAMGHDVRVMLPGYGLINSRRFQIHSLLRMRDIEIPLGREKQHAHIKSSYLNSENQKVLVYFLANDRYFNRDGLYYSSLTKKYFADNDERFIFFCRGVLETLKRLQWQPDVIHCNDWQCGLIPAYLKSLYKDDPYFRNMKTVFTVYSLASHGTFPHSSLEKSGIPGTLFNGNGDKLNFLNAGLSFADVVTTFGNKADKGIRRPTDNGEDGIPSRRKNGIISMNNISHNGSGHAEMAERFVDVYRGLTKNG